MKKTVNQREPNILGNRYTTRAGAKNNRHTRVNQSRPSRNTGPIHSRTSGVLIHFALQL